MTRPQGLSHSFSQRTNRGSLQLERLEDRVVPGETFSSLFFLPVWLVPAGEAPAQGVPADDSAALDAACGRETPSQQTVSLSDAEDQDRFSAFLSRSDSAAEQGQSLDTATRATPSSGSTSDTDSLLAGVWEELDSESMSAGSHGSLPLAQADATSPSAMTSAGGGFAASTFLAMPVPVGGGAISHEAAPPVSAFEGGGGVAEPMLHVMPQDKPGGGGKPGGGTPAGYSPAQMRHAYGFDQLSQDGAGQTIAIVDAYDAPNIQSDLDTFSNQFGLPTTGSGQFTFTKAYAQGSKPSANVGWAQEISLDVEWAHAVAPKANILLVEAANNSYANLLGAVDYAVGHGAHVVSMSWGGGDSSGEAAYDSHFNVPGVTFVASSGDSGGVVNYPAASPYVLSVGGSHLPLNSGGSLTGAETGWSGSGGGVSGYEAIPGYQSGYLTINTNGHRATPDVSYNADPYTGVAVYDSYGASGSRAWMVFGGTSAGAPQWAGLIALANQGRSTPLSSSNLTSSPEYNAATANYAGNYRDITSGSAGSYTASAGYDLVTGLGSPQANNLVPWLIAH